MRKCSLIFAIQYELQVEYTKHSIWKRHCFCVCSEEIKPFRCFCSETTVMAKWCYFSDGFLENSMCYSYSMMARIKRKYFAIAIAFIQCRCLTKEINRFLHSISVPKLRLNQMNNSHLYIDVPVWTNPWVVSCNIDTQSVACSYETTNVWGTCAKKIQVSQ